MLQSWIFIHLSQHFSIQPSNNTSILHSSFIRPIILNLLTQLIPICKRSIHSIIINNLIELEYFYQYFDKSDVFKMIALLISIIHQINSCRHIQCEGNSFLFRTLNTGLLLPQISLKIPQSFYTILQLDISYINQWFLLTNNAFKRSLKHSYQPLIVIFTKITYLQIELLILKAKVGRQKLLFINQIHPNSMKTRRAYQIQIQKANYDNTQFSDRIDNHSNSEKNQLKKKNMGHWNPEQQALYYIFLKNHKENFVKKELRRTDKIFKEMSKFVKTRCPDQCRSHHQKMENKFPQFDHILDSLKLNCSQNIVENLLKQFQQEIKGINSPCQTAFQDQPPGNLVKEEECGVVTQEEIPLLTLQEIISISQAIKPNPLLADQLFKIEAVNPF